MKLRIIAPGIRATPGTQVYLDDVLLNKVVEARIVLNANDVNRACLEFIPSQIEIEGEFEVGLRRQVTGIKEDE